MGLGFGSLKQMNDTFRYNRELLGKKKSSREALKENAKNYTGNSDYSNANLEYVQERVSKTLYRNETKEFLVRLIIITISIVSLSVLCWKLFVTEYSVKIPGRYSNKSALFKTVYYNQDNGLILKTDYFDHGSKAAETFLKNGLKHQNSESYYQTGQQFRSALYFYDTLITEVYFYKSGDTIQNFPKILDNEVHHIRLKDKLNTTQIEFDFYDGKILSNTYKETVLR